MHIHQKTYTSSTDWPAFAAWLAPRDCSGSQAEETVQEILTTVQRNKDIALLEYTRRFDSPDFPENALRVPLQDLQKALAAIPEEDRNILREAAQNIRDFHTRQKQQTWMHMLPGLTTGQRVIPVERAGLYVPGGQGGETPLLSSLLMNAIPAQVAGVRDIIVVSPPKKDGSLNPYILATAAILGIEQVFCCGSAWAIAALAYGTETIPAVDVIAGPGNIFVTTAKRLLVGKVGIDMIAGPSEIAILADDSAHPAWIAADMLSQAEHDPLASSILISPSTNLLQATQKELQKQTEHLPRKKQALQSLKDWGGLITVPHIEAGVDLINRLAPEHCELAITNPWDYVPHIQNAGALFLGQHSPEALGDYFAGPNHVLPTLGTARFSSALSVETFCKKTSIICASEGYAQTQATKVARIARLEGLEGHARSMEYRAKP